MKNSCESYLGSVPDIVLLNDISWAHFDGDGPHLVCPALEKGVHVRDIPFQNCQNLYHDLRLRSALSTPREFRQPGQILIDHFRSRIPSLDSHMRNFALVTMIGLLANAFVP